MDPRMETHMFICFTLVVDDFRVKYVGQQHAEHLVSVIEQNHECTKDWEGKKYLGLTFNWDSDQRGVHLLMPDYVSTAL